MLPRRTILTGLALAFTLVAAAPIAHAQDENTSRRGRKYKAPPETSHIEVQVIRDSNQKPLVSASVIFRAVKDGKDEGNLQVKTNEDGKAIIDVIATGSSVGVQVIADGYATFAGEYLVKEPTRDIQIRMVRPRAQISTYVETHGQPSERAIGVQEPVRPVTQPVIQAPQPTNHTSDPTPLAPVTPDATPGNSQNRTTGKPTGVPPPQA